MKNRFPIITLCGSTRFKEDFMRVQKYLTLKGYIVISVGLFAHSGDEEVWDSMDEGTKTNTKMMLDSMHKEKIRVVNGRFCPQSVRNFCPIVAGFNAGTYKVPACVL